MQSSTPDRVRISEADAADQGITTSHERMANNELRYRLTAADGSGYIRTVASGEGAWQNSHFHRTLLETYIVQSGWVALVELVDGALSWAILESGDVFTTTPLTPHNVYMPGNAVLHTVKHGSSTDEVDWHASPELDYLTKGLDESEIRSRRS
jgi:mannose-6-phosphate isomerase-like protein (cupin superfamily)